MRIREYGLACCLAVGLALAASPVPAQGIFESIFGVFQRPAAPPAPPPQARSYAEPVGHAPQALNPPQEHGESGMASAYCVRTCDGFAFPVKAHAGMSVAEACRSFCPGSETRLYSGGKIDDAIGRDGRRYADLPNAFLYRKQLVAGCTCNGRNAFGLSHVTAVDDPTLRPGDVVATDQGLVVFTGRKNKSSEFTPVKDYSHFSPSYRAQLKAIRIASPTPGAPGEFTSSAARASANQSAQLER